MDVNDEDHYEGEQRNEDDDDIVEFIELDDQELDDDEEDAEELGASGDDRTRGNVQGNMEEEEDDTPVEMITDDADIVFSKHTGSVFCCDLEPLSGQVAISGGEDDHAFVWNTKDGNVLFECTGHKDSVTCSSFSHDGKFVATGDMSGVVQVWQLESKSKLWSFETSDLTWLQWHHSSHVLFAGTMDGDLWMWRMPNGECKTFSGHGSPTDCAKLFPDGKRLAVGYGDGSIRIWDLKAATTLHNVAGEAAHGGDVTCLDCYHDDVLVMSGSVDGTAKLINSANGKVLARLNCKTQEEGAGETQNSVESVGFCSSLPLCATATLKGQLAIWDVPTQIQRQICKHDEGIVRLVWDHVSPLIYTAGMDGIVRLWDARSGNIASQWTGHNGEILDVVLSRDGSSILTASDDKTCRLFHVYKPDR